MSRWVLKTNQRTYQVGDSQVVAMVTTCDAYGPAPGVPHVAVCVDDLSLQSYLPDLDLTAEEKASFESIWEKLRIQALKTLGFTQEE